MWRKSSIKNTTSLKTSDNFYLYKTDIKRWITAMRQDEEWTRHMCSRATGFFGRRPPM